MVAGVQEETWPDLRLRGSLLGAAELAEAAADPRRGSPTGAGADVDAAMLAAKLLAEERRLFYVAVTRARRPLVVTAAGGEDSDQRPSRFLTELAGDDVPIERVGGGHGAARWLSLPALVADLRRAAADPGRPHGGPRRPPRPSWPGSPPPGSAPRTRGDWYALTELSDAGPIVAGGETVRLSPSQVESFTRCGLRWLLEAAVGAGRSDVLRHLGTVIHAAAVLAAEGATEQAGGRPDRRDLAPPGFRQRLVQRQAAGAGRAHGPQVPGLARRQPPRAGRGRAGAQGPDRPGGDHRPGGPAGVRRAGPRGRR